MSPCLSVAWLGAIDSKRVSITIICTPSPKDTIRLSLLLRPICSAHFDHIDNRLEAERLVHRQAAQNLPVQRHPALPLQVDESRVAHSILPHARIQPLYPQLPKLALLVLPVAVGVLPRFFEAADGDAEASVGPSAKAFGLADDPFVLR